MSSASLQLGGDNWAAKDGNLLGYQKSSSSSVHIPHEFTFTRGSNLAATRVAANGLIEKGRENLLLQSNQFDTTWTLSSTSVTSGQAGYDGTNDAWLLNSTTTGFPRIHQNVTSNGVSTYSVYAKPATDGFINMRTFGTDAAVWFNLNDGVVVNASGSQYVSSSIESVGDGWYRCSVIVNGSLTSLRIYPASSYGNYSTNGNGVYIQDAQLEQGVVATDYIETGATTVQAGLLENEPRIDYTGGTGSLLLEPSRTNLIKYSECFDEWGHYSNATAQLANVLSPEGKLNAYEFTFDGTTNGRIQDTIPVTNGNTYTFSVYLKNKNISTPTQVWIGFSNPSSQGEYVTVTNEWQRFETTQVADSGSAEYPRVLCNGVGSIYGYGAQMEEASYPTSYIPNHSGGSVTRSNDDVNDFDISSMLTSSSFTWFLDLNDYIGSDINSPIFWLQSTSSVQIEFRVRADGYRFYYNNIAGGSAYPIAGSTTANKFCVSYDGNDYRLYVDGVLQATTASVGDSGWDKIRNSVLASLPLKQMLLFPTALSNADCITLTT